MVDFDRFKVAESVDTIARELDFFTIKPSRFVLTNLTANHHVTRAGVADDIDVTHVGAASRIDRIDNAHGFVFFIGHRVGRCRTEGISERRVLFGNLATDVVNKFRVIGRPDFKLLR